MGRVLRIGTVPYLVGRPVDEGLAEEPGVELVQAVPARLVDGLRDGSIDVALVSSIELFRRPGYGYVDGPAVAGRGRVSSVQVFLRRELAEVRSVALDPASRTAAALVQLVMPGAPEFVEVAPDADPRDAEADAWLRIGDAALRETFAPDAPPTFNPSAAWVESTGLPFVFAPWIVAPGVDPTPWLPAFARARERGEARRARLADEAAGAWGIPREAARQYLLEECWYDPGTLLEPALLAYRDRAAERGLCRGDLTPTAVPLGTRSEA